MVLPARELWIHKDPAPQKSCQGQTAAGSMIVSKHQDRSGNMLFNCMALTETVSESLAKEGAEEVSQNLQSMEFGTDSRPL